MNSLQNIVHEMHLQAIEDEMLAHEALIDQLDQAHQARITRINERFGFNPSESTPAAIPVADVTVPVVFGE
ncbi:MAG: hypothetical protein BWK73_04585 [Thiothrix lacustris]|uniref:Uncharacterized protein n=1 Tax=Thiothrix lacustris TaxID=525917 RepID=A0A1Y1QXG3_9GAMM|nr:MAG: hypothetical protein BWK73_04585 [Thiothrix lacustris]